MQRTSGLQTASGDFGQEILRLKRSLARSEQELKHAKVIEANLRAQLGVLSSDSGELENRVHEQEKKRLEEKEGFASVTKNLNQQIVDLRDALWTETCKSSFLSNQLTDRKNRIGKLEEALAEADRNKHKILESFLAQQNAQTLLTDELQNSVQQLTEHNARMEEEVSDAERTRQEAEKMYVKELDMLQDTVDKLGVDARNKDTQIVALTRELTVTKQHLDQFTTNPTAQFKLISDLYTAYVTAEDKVAALEKNERELVKKEKYSTEAVKQFSDELADIRGKMQECEAILTRAHRELLTQKKLNLELKEKKVAIFKGAGNLSRTSDMPFPDLSESVPGSVSNSDTQREAETGDTEVRTLELYRMQSEDSDVANFVRVVAKNPDVFQQLTYLATNEAVLWAFVKQHDAGNYIAERKSLKHEIAAAKLNLQFEQSRSDRIQSELNHVKQVAGMEIQDLKTALGMAQQMENSLNLRVLETQQDKLRLEASQQHYANRCEDLYGQLVLAEKRREDLTKELQEKIDALANRAKDLRDMDTKLRNLSSRVQELVAQSDVELEVAGSHESTDFLRNIETTAELAYKLPGPESLELQDLASITRDRDNLKFENQTLRMEVVSLQANRRNFEERSSVLQTTIRALNERIKLEENAHAACTEANKDLQKEIDELKSVVNVSKACEVELQRALENVTREGDRQTKRLQDQITLLEEERKNCEHWKKSVGSRLGNSAASDSFHLRTAINHIRSENSLLRAQLKLMKAESAAYVVSLAAYRDTIQQLQSKYDLASLRPEDSVEAAVWQQRYKQKAELLRAAVESAGILREDLSQAKEVNEKLNASAQLRQEELARLDERVKQLNSEKIEMIKHNQQLTTELELSNKRFDSDEQRREIESLKKSKSELEQKHKNVTERQKEFYQTQFAQMKAKHGEQLNAKDVEKAVLVEEHGVAMEEKQQELSALQSTMAETKIGMDAKNNEFTTKLQTIQRQLLTAQKSRTSLVEQHQMDLAKAQEEIMKLRGDLLKANEIIARLEALRLPTQAPPTSIQASSPVRTQSVIHDAYRPVIQTVLGSSSTRSTAVVTPQTHPVISVHRVTPQLRIPEVPVLAVTPQSQESALAMPPHLIPSTSQTSPAATVFHQHEAGTRRTDDGSMPSTSSVRADSPQGHKRTRSSDLLEPALGEQKRRREASPTSSDVTSSTNTAAQNLHESSGVATGSLRDRSNSRSAATSEISPHAFENLQRTISSEDRAVDSSDNAAGDDNRDNDQVTESIEMQDFGGGGEDVNREEEEERNDQFLDYETDDSNQYLQPSDEAQSPAEIAFDDPAPAVDLPDDALDFVVAPDGSSFSHDISSERPGDCSSTSTREFPTSSARLRPSPLPLDSLFPPQLTLRMPGQNTVTTPAHYAPRTPFSSAYDTGDDGNYGVVPSTPKFALPRREEEGNMLPQVPSLFFGNISDTIEDVTASQVPPTPNLSSSDFFGQQRDAPFGNNGDSSHGSQHAADMENMFLDADMAGPSTRPIHSQPLRTSAGPSFQGNFQFDDMSPVASTVPSPGIIDPARSASPGEIAATDIIPVPVSHQSGMSRTNSLAVPTARRGRSPRRASTSRAAGVNRGSLSPNVAISGSLHQSSPRRSLAASVTPPAAVPERIPSEIMRGTSATRRIRGERGTTRRALSRGLRRGRRPFQ